MGSAIAGKGKVGYKEALVGTISGGVIMASAAPIIYNIGLVIMIGAIAGFISGIYMRTAHLKINSTSIVDYMGLFGPFLISAFLGSFVVTPAALAYYYNRGTAHPSTAASYPFTLMGWQLIYVGISAAIGLAGGIITGLICICDKDYFGLATNSRFF